MSPILVHVLILLLLAIPIVRIWLHGQPGHQATAAAWALGLLFVAGLWLAQLVVSSGLLAWRFRVRKPTLPVVLGLHVVSAVIVGTVLYISAWFLNAL